MSHYREERAKVTVLFLAANPERTAPLAIAEEMREIVQKVRASAYRDVLEFQASWAARPDDLLQKLNEYQPQVVHFSGHGSARGLSFVGQDGLPQRVTTAALSHVFATMKENIRVIFLNACLSREQAEALVEVVDCVIGMKEAIHDVTAATFASSFYRAIAFGQSIQNAFDQGIASLHMEGNGEEDIPILLVKEGIDAEKIVLIPTREETETPSSQPGHDEQVWMVPYRRNTYFTGREEVLTDIHARFMNDRTALLTQGQAIHGLGGIGKTQIAVEYVYRYRDEYRFLLWASAASEETLRASYVQMADHLQLPERTEQEQENVVGAVQHWLATHKEWLLVVDNANEMKMVWPLLPKGNTGHLLLMARDQVVSGMELFPVEPMDDTEGTRFLLRRAGVLRMGRDDTLVPVAEQEAAVQLVAELGGLPLALDQAGAYIEETQCSVQAYLDLYQQQRHKEFLARRGGGHVTSEYPESVVTTWSLSFQRIEAANPLAVELLRMCAFLAPDAIPDDLLRVGLAMTITQGKQRRDWFSPFFSRHQPRSGSIHLPVTEGMISDAVAILRAYSLIARDADEKTMRVHRLVQVMVRDALPTYERIQWMQRAVIAVNSSILDVQDVRIQSRRIEEQTNLWYQQTFSVHNPNDNVYPVTMAISILLALQWILFQMGTIVDPIIKNGYLFLKKLLTEKFGATSRIMLIIDSVENGSFFLSSYITLAAEMNIIQANQDHELRRAAHILLQMLFAPQTLPLPNYVMANNDDTQSDWGRLKPLQISSPTIPLQICAPDKKTLQRMVDISIIRQEDQTNILEDLDLEIKRTYILRLDIRPQRNGRKNKNTDYSSIRVNSISHRKDGYWLEVVVVSEDMAISSQRHALFLPTYGPSWVCHCQPGQDHECNVKDRQPFLFIPMQTPKRPQIARTRITIYYQRNVIQSQLLTIKIADKEQVGASQSSIIDYTLSSELRDLSFLLPRTLNILTNDKADGSHRLIINGEEDEVLAFHITEGQIRVTVDAAREALRNIHFEEYGGMYGSQQQRHNLLDNNHAKTKDAFIRDLKRVAPLGWKLWALLFNDRLEWRKKLLAPATIQVARTLSSTLAFPWALMYDIPLDSQGQYIICPLLEHWDEHKGFLDFSQSCCPHEQSHGRKNTLCPYGFWGFRHTIEQPPSMSEGRSLPMFIHKTHQKPEMLTSFYPILDTDHTEKHLHTLKKQLTLFTVEDRASLQAIITALADPIEVVYFYCHGGRELLAGTSQHTPFLQVGKNERFQPSDITTWRVADWSEDHWEKTSPLVFINGCHTAELTPELLVNFVDAFSTANAAGVIGTEISIEQHVAAEAAESFFTVFQHNKTVGQSLQQMRIHFLAKGNLLGLAYTPYCSTSLHL